MIKFQVNGIKADGQYFSVWYSEASRVDGKKGIDVYASSLLTEFSESIKKTFQVQDDTDMATDYFDKERFFVEINHPRYPEVLKAMMTKKASTEKRNKKYTEQYFIEKHNRKTMLKITDGIDPAELQEMAEHEGWDS